MLLYLALLVASEAATVVPTSGMVITQDTVFTPGTYHLTEGIRIAAVGVKLSMNGAMLIGPNSSTAMGIVVANVRSVTIDGGGGGASGWFYGLFGLNTPSLTVTNCVFSNNWVDPKSLGPSPPWLNIMAPMDMRDNTNLGGGVLLAGCPNFLLTGVIAEHQENGFSVYDCVGGGIKQCSGSNNTGWGVHCNHCTNMTIDSNHFDHCNRANLGDSAGILLVNGSCNNRINGNMCRYSGDGFFIGNEYSPQNNGNLVTNNDCSHASANAFEATFASGNQFIGNVASLSNFGFWLGYAFNCTVQDNEIIGNGCGIQIDHGQNHQIIGNKIISNTNGPGIYVDTDGSSPFPPAKWPWLKLPHQDESTNYVIVSNWFVDNNNFHVQLVNTTSSLVYNNYFGTARGNTKVISADGLSTASSAFSAPVAPYLLPDGERNIVSGRFLAGNWYPDYFGQDTTGDGIGQTNLPYTNGGNIQGANVGDFFPYKLPNQP